MRSALAILAVSFAACSGMDAGTIDSGTGPNDGKGGTADARDGDARNNPDGGVVTSNGVTVIVEPDGQGGAELVSAIDAASQSVYMTMYQIDNAAVLSALVGRKQAGKDVQVILDSSSQSKSWNTSAYNQLNAAGISVVWSSTAFTYTHEKTVIIDGQTAWIMTMNANTSSPKYNREYLAIDGDAADVAEATAVFVADHAKQSITPSGSLVVANNNARTKLVALIDSASSTLDIEVEEFSDTYSTGIASAVARAANRGVKVRIVIANQTFNSSTTQAIATVKAAGAKVVMTGPTSGGGTASNPYIHAKAMVVDCSGTTCARGFVGSENLSGGSLGYNRELGVTFADPAQLAKIETAISTDYANGTPK